MHEVDTVEKERGQSGLGLVLRHKRDGRRVYSPSHKLAIVEQCLQPGVSVAGIALAHGINANLVRKWIVKHRRAAPEATRASVVPATLLPVAVQAVSPRSAAGTVTARGTIIVEVHGARVELMGGVDGDALRTVLRVLSAVSR
ncbi:MAG: transposase [Burkholderiaceae bacterium]|jgi:transposase|nr:transposase [Burkholderiaceae bacterium]